MDLQLHIPVAAGVCSRKRLWGVDDISGKPPVLSYLIDAVLLIPDLRESTACGTAVPEQRG